MIYGLEKDEARPRRSGQCFAGNYLAGGGKKGCAGESWRVRSSRSAAPRLILHAMELRQISIITAARRILHSAVCRFFQKSRTLDSMNSRQSSPIALEIRICFIKKKKKKKKQKNIAKNTINKTSKQKSNAK
jgi:hypothetical protein